MINFTRTRGSWNEEEENGTIVTLADRGYRTVSIRHFFSSGNVGKKLFPRSAEIARAVVAASESLTESNTVVSTTFV